jgi:hypothetical protein
MPFRGCTSTLYRRRLAKMAAFKPFRHDKFQLESWYVPTFRRRYEWARNGQESYVAENYTRIASYHDLGLSEYARDKNRS